MQRVGEHWAQGQLYVDHYARPLTRLCLLQSAMLNLLQRSPPLTLPRVCAGFRWRKKLYLHVEEAV